MMVRRNSLLRLDQEECISRCCHYRLGLVVPCLERRVELRDPRKGVSDISFDF